MVSLVCNNLNIIPIRYVKEKHVLVFYWTWIIVDKSVISVVFTANVVLVI